MRPPRASWPWRTSTTSQAVSQSELLFFIYQTVQGTIGTRDRFTIGLRRTSVVPIRCEFIRIDSDREDLPVHSKALY